MTQYFTGLTCDPFAPRSSPCTIGNYNSYTINVRNAADVQAAVKFAREKNLRFVVRNTGHDYWGRSSGHGALGVRMSNLKGNRLVQWNDKGYKGPAFKLGAGMMGFEAQQALDPLGYVMLTGYCPEVAPAGGYTQGGGHSPLSGNFGMAADQTLEFEVVLADGKLVKASRFENSDLFAALNGGGAGNWGVVISMTVRVYPKVTMGAATLYVDATTVPSDKFWAMVDKFYSLVPGYTKQGAYISYAFGPVYFGLFPFSMYNKTADDVRTMLKPFSDYLKEIGVTPAIESYTDAPSYVEHMRNFGTSNPMREWTSGGRLMPIAVMEDPTRRAQLVNTLRQLVGLGLSTSSTSITPKSLTGNPTSLNAAWRKMAGVQILTFPWTNGGEAEHAAMRAKVQQMASEWVPMLTQVAPDSASYANEADPLLTNWQSEIYGSNYNNLLQVKKRYDPDGFFYSLHTPGAENWVINDQWRMCRK
jgi:FAD/FMN-containing dehydrogenase